MFGRPVASVVQRVNGWASNLGVFPSDLRRLVRRGSTARKSDILVEFCSRLVHFSAFVGSTCTGPVLVRAVYESSED